MLTTNRNRRAFLKTAGICIALPTLESLKSTAIAKPAIANPIRMVCIGNEFGMYPGAFWAQPGQDAFSAATLLKPLAAHRDALTVFSHLDHGLKGGHFAVHTFLTGVKSTEAKGMEDGGISLDQRAAEFVGSQTRFPTLNVGSESGLHGGCQISWTRTGTRVPPIPGPRELFRQLFVEDTKIVKQKAASRIALRSSILDVVADDAKSLKRRLNLSDGHKLEEYFASIRDVESKLQLDQQWQNIPKPTAPFDEPENQGLTRDLPKIYDLLALALQTDSTRIATLEVGGSFAASDLGIRKGYHALSHHGQVQESIDQLVQIELYQVEQYARFIDKLRNLTEPNSDGNLLDRTMVLFGSGMGNANSHTNNDLPIVLAGGGFRHLGVLELPQEQRKRQPLCNLYVSMLQRFGLEIDRFSNASSRLSGLELS